MGGRQSSVIYSVSISDAKKGETAIYRHPESRNGLLTQPSGDCNTLQDCLLKSVRKNSNNRFLGTKDANNVYQWKSYQECFDLAKYLGLGILELELAPEINEWNNMSMNFIAIWSKNREEWYVTDMACILYGFVSVPIYDTLGPNSVEFILNQTNLTTIFCTKDMLKKFIKDGKFCSVRNIVHYDSKIDEEDIQALDKAGIKAFSFSDVIEKGKNRKEIEYPKLTPSSIYTFSYTSGTTGNPKGAMLSHGNFTSVVAVGGAQINIRHTDIHISYLPLAHVLERLVINAAMDAGAQVGFFGGDVQKLKDDLQALKPTIFVSVPRLLSRFYDVMNEGVKKLQGCKKNLATKAVQTKLNNIKSKGTITHFTYDKIVFKKMKAALGGRVRWMLTGSAPISSEVMNFLKIACSCPIIEGYGQTESTGASFVTSFLDNSSGHVGGPTRNTEFKLVDVPDMAYTSFDKDDNGNPQPRGEVCFRGPGVFCGYYKDEEKTAEAVDADGWLHSGDIAKLNPNGSISLIDRKKNIFKLSHGEYVAAEKIENIYLRCKSVAEIFVYGDSLQAFLVAVVFPEQKVVEKYSEEKNIKGNFEQLVKNDDIVNMIIDEMNKQGKAEKLLGFEMVKKIHLVSESFATKDLLTTTFKLKRHDAKKYYQQVLDDLYKS